jgi:hypothetical protein
MPFATMGELMDALPRQRQILGVDFWLKDIQEENPAEVWNELRSRPVNEECVLILAGCLRSAISYEASHWSVPEPYHDTLQRGHELLKLLFLIAHDQGLGLSIGQIDGPLTMTEQMEVAGFITITDGKVQLTEEATRMLDEFKRQLEQQ